MHLDADCDSDSGHPAHDEKDADQPGNAGPETSRRTGRGRKAAIRPGHDHA